jgi:putative NADPH-quinone reductase
MKTLLILGSARDDGCTRGAAERLRNALGPGCLLADLCAYRIEPFRYAAPPDDDFVALAGLMVQHEAIVFATPVYWYAMSGLMKIFFDRLTDLTGPDESRPLGRLLRGRSIWLLATGTDVALPTGFEEPFARTAAYFGMHWRGGIYLQADPLTPPQDQDFGAAEALANAILG